MKLTLPDYENCLTNLTASIAKEFELTPSHSSIKEIDEILKEKDYKNIILILFDGMGSLNMDIHLPKDSFLQKHKIKNITSVFPATTTAATTSVLTGLNPNEHSWLGWDIYVEEIDKAVTMFTNTLKGTETPASSENIIKKYFPTKDITKKIVENGKYNSYSVSPFGDVPYKIDDLDDMNEKIKSICQKDSKKFIYVYHNNPDHSMHDYGIRDSKIKDVFNTIDKKCEELANNLEDALIIITADHGLLDTENYYLCEYPDIFSLLEKETSIEPRATTYFVKKDKSLEFEKLFNKYFSKDFMLLNRQEVIDKQIFGTGTNSKRFYSCLGDYLSIGIGNKCIEMHVDENPLKALHGSITEFEMIIPLIVIKK